MAVSKSESDVILNRANVALARSQRLVASWLPAQTEDELANTKSEEELQREEDEIFTAVPETYAYSGLVGLREVLTFTISLGIGAPLPEKAADGSWNRTELSSNDKLRKQLLGKNYDKVMKAAAANKAGGVSSQAGKTATSTATPAKNEESDDDDDQGRAAMVGKKKRKIEPARSRALAETQKTGQTDGGDESGSAKETLAQPAPSKGRKKAMTYLDELLAERAKKRKKR